MFIKLIVKKWAFPLLFPLVALAQENGSTASRGSAAKSPIYEIGKKFTYSVKAFDKEGKEKIYHIFNKSAYYIVMEILPDGIDKKEKEKIYHIFNKPVHYIVMEILPDRIMGGLQTEFAYRYCEALDSCAKKSLSERSGLIEDLIEKEWKIWWHPPRWGDFKILEYTPFPEIRLLKQQWKKRLYIYMEGFREFFKGIHEYEWKEPPIIYSTYFLEAEPQEALMGKEKLLCKKVSAQSQSEIGNGKAAFYFHEKHGFVKLVFDAINGDHIELELIHVEPPK